MESYECLLGDEEFESIHPSLQRQAVLNMAYGRYEVLPDRIYQVRGFDLANMTIVWGDIGWIIFVPLTARETAAAALKLVNDQLGERPATAVVYSHSHGDHFGGARGVVDQKDVDSGAASVEGERAIIDELAGMLVQFELGSEVMPGTGTADLTPEKNPFEADTPALTDGG